MKPEQFKISDDGTSLLPLFLPVSLELEEDSPSIWKTPGQLRQNSSPRTSDRRRTRLGLSPERCGEESHESHKLGHQPVHLTEGEVPLLITASQQQMLKCSAQTYTWSGKSQSFLYCIHWAFKMESNMPVSGLEIWWLLLSQLSVLLSPRRTNSSCSS